MDQDKVIHVPGVILDAVLLLDKPVDGVKIVKRKPLAGLVAKRQTFAGIFIMAVDDHEQEIPYPLIRKCGQPLLQHFMIYVVEVFPDIAFEEVSPRAILPVELSQEF